MRRKSGANREKDREMATMDAGQEVRMNAQERRRLIRRTLQHLPDKELATSLALPTPCLTIDEVTGIYGFIDLTSENTTFVEPLIDADEFVAEVRRQHSLAGIFDLLFILTGRSEIDGFCGNCVKAISLEDLRYIRLACRPN